MAEHRSYLIIGNGIAGATAAELLRSEDNAADITVVANDPFPVYYRPALKDYLGGKVREQKLWVRPVGFYSDHHIQFLADTVVKIQPEEHTVLLDSGQQLGYDRLLLAHGARPSTLTCPGLNLTGVATLRTVADYQKVLARLGLVKRVVVVGSGTLALESIETLRHRGYQVTHLLRRRTLWSEVLDPTASDLVLQQEMRDGVDVRSEQEIAEITGKEGSVTRVITTTGAHIPCEMVLLGIGIEPIVDFVKDAGIACGRGIKVDGVMRVNAPGIYAAGDAIETSDPITGRTRVIGQWYPAIQQARAAAYSMLDLLDTAQPFHFGNFYNACFLYGLNFASVGISAVPKQSQGYQEIVADPQPRTYQKVILKDDVPVGMLALGNRDAVLSFKRAIDHNVNLSPIVSRLFAPDFKLNEWLDAQGIPPPILGVNREGAMVVQKAAYAGATTRSVILTPQSLDEGVLVQIDALPDASAAREIYLSQVKVTTVGRQEGMSIVVDHHSVSRRHAEISYANGHYVLRDLKSKNGTFINGKKVEPGSISFLNSDDLVRFGQIAFAFRLRHTDVSSSLLVRQQVEKQPGETLSLSITATNNSPIKHEDQNGDKTIVVTHTPGTLSQGEESSLQRLLIANPADLLSSGTESSLSPTVVAAMQETPALVTNLQGKLGAFLLKPGKRFLLGREKNCDIVLADISISRTHAEVFPGPEGLYIRDMQSSNGVQVNHTKIDSPYHLTSGDSIILGNITLYFVDHRPRKAQLPV